MSATSKPILRRPISELTEAELALVLSELCAWDEVRKLEYQAKQVEDALVRAHKRLADAQLALDALEAR